ncbi:putative Actin-related protein 3 [Paratrimastix pyriformis]|uniref:Actin-related protein 3 n=1 Tax=Paratrimastix pyriformis TaxID=342808 RepID=A0ABQ8UU89_9EUKA|nr:putative Actin-related protein 3 [Paratrimastix pyriformis]|eukprot:GAFH01001724.1.p2 GENE.GAFH01001724.1~~GAFH01001724.1.p2  ORF type:complete len:415 (-),score=106.80 GAFH01001724.1:191-1435(-)
MAGKTPIVIDAGTGYTKLGYAGNLDPAHIIPTVVATRDTSKETTLRRQPGLEDLDFYVGDEVNAHKTTHLPMFPIRHGQVEDWDLMERFYEQALFKYLRCEPEEHLFMMSEPPLNTPENRELLAEVMFETFNVKGMYIANQAVLALAASSASNEHAPRELTGTVIDSGDGVTRVIPVSDGCVIPGSIKSIPLAGREITRFIQEFQREREPGVVPPEDAMEVAKNIKENQCYICRDLVREYQRYDAQPDQYFMKYQGQQNITKRPYTLEVGYERFLAPELYFNPEIFSTEYSTPLPDVVDATILSCPIDTRRSLYRNIVLSGGSTLFRNFSRRLQDAVREKVDARVHRNEELTHAKVTPIEVNVLAHPLQKFAVWSGGSILANQEQFVRMCHTKEQYDEVGPSLCRHNLTFTSAC